MGNDGGEAVVTEPLNYPMPAGHQMGGNRITPTFLVVTIGGI